MQASPGLVGMVGAGLLSLTLGCSNASGGGGERQSPPIQATTPEETATSAGDLEGWLDAPVPDLVEAINQGTLRCESLFLAHRRRIEARDSGAAGIHAFLALDPRAHATARALDAESDGPSRPLRCAVFAVKDNINQAKMATTAGSVALKRNVVEADAPVLARLRQAGAVFIGKANLSEWANFRDMDSSSGWSSLGGQTHNGFDPTYNPCGSSSGSAAAVAAKMATAAVGTETIGSIVCPASVHGLVGFKPTLGLVSRAGIIPVSSTYDTAGPITRDVTSAAVVLSVMAGRDDADPLTATIPEGLSLDFMRHLDGASFRGARVGYDSDMTSQEGTQALFATQLALIQSAGATLVPISLSVPRKWREAHFQILLHDFKDDLNGYLLEHRRSGQPASLSELIAFNRAHASQTMPHFGQRIFEIAQSTGGKRTALYHLASAQLHGWVRAEGIVAHMAARDLDLVIAPTLDPAWRTDHLQGDAVGGVGYVAATLAGLPHLTVPMGLVGSMPVGLSLFAGRWEDGRVLAMGRAYEKLRGPWAKAR